MGNLTVKKSGEMASFISPNVSNITSFKVHFSPRQEGSGDPSPDNVREITGWNGVEIGLPDEYQEVEWIQSTEKKQFILLPYGFEETDTVTITASIDTEYGTDRFIIAPTTWNNNNNRFAMVGVYNHTYCVGYGNRSTGGTRLEPSVNNDGDMHTWTFANKTFEITDLGLSKNVSNITFGGVTSNLKLFYGYNQNINGKLSYYKHVKLNGEVYEFIPCYRKSDGEIGLYDIKNHVFYTNDGTGSFLKGKDVNNIITNINWTDNIGTIYGGYVDLISGELVQEYFKYSFTGDEDIRINTNYVNTPFQFDTRTNDLTMPFGNNPNVKPYCNILNTQTSRYHYISDNTAVINSIAGYSQVLFRGDIFGDTAETAKAKLKELYENETPLTIVGTIRDTVIDNFKYQLTPQQLSTLKGQNNFWSNADYVEIEYELTETFDIQKAKRKIILNQPHVESASGDIVTFDTDMKGKLKECKVYFSPVQEGEGDPSPDNVRNITGWNGVSVAHTNKNLIRNDDPLNPNANYFNRSGSKNPVVYSNEEQAYTDLSTLDSNNGGISEMNHAKINATKNDEARLFIAPKSSTYTFSIDYKNVGTSYGIRVYTVKSGVTKRIKDIHGDVDGIWHTQSLSVDLNKGDSIKVYCYNNIYWRNITLIEGENIEYVENITTEYSIDWTDSTGTVYGGYVDLVSGELVVTHKYASLNDPAKWSAFSGYETTIFVYNNSFFDRKIFDKTTKGFICSLVSTNNTANYWGRWSSKNSDTFWIKNNDSVDSDLWISLEEIKQNASDGNIFICYELAEPIHYQLTPQQILTLKGQNNVYSDTNGQTEIKYWKH